MSSVPVASVRIPNVSALRSSQCIIGQGLFKHHPAPFETSVEDVCVEELVENIKACEDRLNALRQQSHSAISGENEKPHPQQRKTASIRSNSPKPVPKPAWGRNTPAGRAPSPTATPRTQARSTTPMSSRNENRERPWRKTGVERPVQEKEHIDKDDAGHDEEAPIQQAKPSARGRHQEKEIDSVTPRTPNAAQVTKRENPATAAAKKAAQRVANYQRKHSEKDHQTPTPAPTSTPGSVEREMVSELVARVAALEGVLKTTNARNDELSQAVLQLQAQNQQLTHQLQATMSDLTGKWIGLSSQLQFVMTQTVQLNQSQAAMQAAALHQARPGSSSANSSQVPNQLRLQQPSTVVPLRQTAVMPAPSSTHSITPSPDEAALFESEIEASRPRSGPSPQLPTARRLDMSAESIPSAHRLPPSPAVKLQLSPGSTE
jgi:hypothetical protein